jgi:hypothetical protein
MLNGDAARYRTQDMQRSSEAYRAGRDAAKRHTERRNAKVRGVLASVATLFTFPIHR